MLMGTIDRYALITCGLPAAADGGNEDHLVGSSSLPPPPADVPSVDPAFDPSISSVDLPLCLCCGTVDTDQN